MPERAKLSEPAARRALLAAQGLADPRPSGTVTRRHLKRIVSKVKVVQLDSVNVAVRAHYMPMFSRLGPYPRDALDAAAWRHRSRQPRLFAEYWVHEASLFPLEDWPLLRWRMRGYDEEFRRKADSIANRAPELGERVLEAVAELGPVGAGELERLLQPDSRRPKGGWWNRSDVKRVCEWLFTVGRLTTGARNSFQRLYDLPERVIPADVLARDLDEREAVAQLVERSAAALGVATEPDLRDYYRLGPRRCKQAVADLVEAGVLRPVEVAGWQQEAYRHEAAVVPRKVEARALLSPFDPLIWDRERVRRVFGFDYRIEIYVPEPKRKYGYYVFPFLLDDELVARVDLKADRAEGVLRVPGAYAESGTDTSRVASELAAELRSMAGWLELDDIVVAGKGDLAAPLRKLLSGRSRGSGSSARARSSA